MLFQQEFKQIYALSFDYDNCMEKVYNFEILLK